MQISGPSRLPVRRVQAPKPPQPAATIKASPAPAPAVAPAAETPQRNHWKAALWTGIGSAIATPLALGGLIALMSGSFPLGLVWPLAPAGFVLGGGLGYAYSRINQAEDWFWNKIDDKLKELRKP